MGVSAQDCADPAVQMPAHSHLLARSFGVKVHHHRAHAVQLFQRLLDGLKRRARRIQKELAAQIDHAQPARGRIHCGHPATGAGGEEVVGTHDARLLVQIAIDVPLAPNVVAGGDDVHASRQQFVGVLGPDALAVSRVLAIRYHRVGCKALAQLR